MVEAALDVLALEVRQNLVEFLEAGVQRDLESLELRAGHFAAALRLAGPHPLAYRHNILDVPFNALGQFQESLFTIFGFCEACGHSAPHRPKLP